LGRLTARMRSLLTLGLADRIAEMHASTLAMHERLQRIEDDIVALRGIVRTRDDRAQRKLKAALSSLVNLVSILPELDIKGVIPPFPHQGFEITGEEAAYFFHLIRRQRPKLMMELGSGSSTVLFAAALRANGSGRLISIEHESEHAKHTAAMLAQAGLSDRAELVLAPLSDLALNGRTFQWYDLGSLLGTLTEKIDLLFVDGPPGKVQSLSRFPALPILAPHLSPRAMVIVDDGAREDEVRMVELWRELRSVAFETEALDFLPHAPTLLTMTASESRVAELRRAREEHSEVADEDEDVELFGQGRRSGVS
jgi:predicted O-methyltransferase YrrM